MDVMKLELEEAINALEAEFQSVEHAVTLPQPDLLELRTSLSFLRKGIAEIGESFAKLLSSLAKDPSKKDELKTELAKKHALRKRFVKCELQCEDLLKAAITPESSPTPAERTAIVPSTSTTEFAQQQRDHLSAITLQLETTLATTQSAIKQQLLTHPINLPYIKDEMGKFRALVHEYYRVSGQYNDQLLLTGDRDEYVAHTNTRAAHMGCLAQLEIEVDKAGQPATAANSTTTTTCTTSTCTHATCSRLDTRLESLLPKRELIKFGGQEKDWLRFWACFDEIHTHQTLTKMQKFKLLLQALTSSPTLHLK